MLKSLVIVFLPAVFMGCAGAIEDQGGATTGGNAGGGTGGGLGGRGGGNTGGGGAGGIGPSAVECAPTKSIVPGLAPLRRLTRLEYNNTIRALLGDTSDQALGFPEDSVAHGFDNNAETQVVTGTLAGDYFEASEALAAKAAAAPERLVPCDNAKLGDETCGRTFISSFGGRAYRRPLTDPEADRLMATYTAGAAIGGYKNGVKLVIERMLSSPYFIYRAEFGDPAKAPAKGVVRLTSYEMASRLSYFLWNTMPDADLFSAAAANKLQNPADVAAQAQRLIADGKAHGSVARFHEGWLELVKLDRAEKDTKIYPGFEAVRPAMREEVTRFVDEAFWQGDGAIKNLFTADYTFMNKALAVFLKLPGAGTMSTAFQKLPLLPTGVEGPMQRQGMVMLPGLQAAHGKPFETSPILRGKFVLEQFMCVEVPPPPPNIMNNIPPKTATTTTRERYIEHQKLDCASCHRLMDPVGFAFENFDGDGRWRGTENGKPIDASGALSSTDVDGPFSGALALTSKMSGSAQMRSCVARQWFRYTMGRTETEQDTQSLQQLACSFGSGSVRDLLVGLAQTDAFLYKAVP